MNVENSIKCATCGKVFFVSNNRKYSARYCSVDCRNKGYYQPLKHIEKKCLQCGRAFIVSKRREDEAKFCSHECSIIGKTKTPRPFTQVEITCMGCGKKFMVFNFRGQSAKFCSHKCQGTFKSKGNRLEKKCLYCGKTFMVISARKDRRKYCSLECRNKCPINTKNKIPHTLLHGLNKAEAKLNQVIQEMGLPYKFVGNGEVWISGLSPDFINTNGQKKIIEFFGEHWHEGKGVSYRRTENGRKEVFAGYGYDTLIIWGKELKNMEAVKQRILNFDQAEHGK